MRVAITGSAGHLGEGLVRTLAARGDDVVAIDLRASPFTTDVGSITDFQLITRLLRGCSVVFHCASLHKRHLAKHPMRDFVETNVAGTLSILEAAVSAGVSKLVYTSTTSVYGAAFKPREGAPAVMVDEGLSCVPKDIYGVTKKAAEDLCELFAHKRSLPCVVLRVARFYPESDLPELSDIEQPCDLNMKVNDFLYRRVDLEDAVEAHVMAANAESSASFKRYVVSATSPFGREHLLRARDNPAALLRDLVPEYEPIFRRLAWIAPRSIGRVYCNERIRRELGWEPRFDFGRIIARISEGQPPFSDLSRAVGSRPYG